MKKIILIFLMISSVTMAEDDTVTHIEYEAGFPSSLNYSRYYLELTEDSNITDVVHETDLKAKKQLEYSYDIQISNRPKKIVLNATMFVYAHPKYPFSIVFPKGYFIEHIHNFENKELSWKFDKNVVDFKITPDLTEQTAMIKFADQNGNKFATNIIIDRYTKQNGALHNFYTVIEPKRLDLNNVLNEYLNKYKDYPKETTSIKIDEVVYHFVKDDRGNIDIGGKKFFFRYGI